MDSPREVVSELRSIINTFRTTDFEDFKKHEGSFEDLGQTLQFLKDQLAPYQVEAERMQAGLRPEEHFFRPDSSNYDLGETEPREIFPYSPLIGELNPISPPFHFWKSGDSLLGKGSFGSQFCGPPEAVHGGHVAALLDELLGVTGVVFGFGGFTVTLTIRYETTTPLDSDLHVKGWIEDTKERKVVIRGELRTDDTICATAEGIFIRPKQND